MDFNNLRKQLAVECAFPVRFSPGNLLNTAAILFVSLFLFLLLFQPFGAYVPEDKYNYFIICGAHALLPSLIVSIYFTALNYFRKKSPSKWTKSYEYLHIAVILLLVGIGSFLIRDLIYNNPDNWSVRYLWAEIRNCYLAGILFYFFITFAGFYFRSKKAESIAGRPFAAITEANEAVRSAPEIFIKTQVKQDDFSFIADNFLFARAEGNYIELTQYKNDSITTELKRITLKQFESQLAAHSFLFRCHRAYLINLTRIEKVSGNSQGYLLSFNSAADKVPVSRAQLTSFNNRYKQFFSVYSN
jgi:endonuclease IV